MEDESRVRGVLQWALGASGLGAVIAVVTVPKYGIWIAVAILILFLLLFGSYYLWQRLRARSQREKFSAAVEAQTAAAPKSISDPNKRAALDKLRQKFQAGLQEFKSRDKDIYKLPWYVIIGEPASGKTEAIRHSGIDFPPGLQEELQGAGGTVNMDWWFTNRGIILDTAGSMIFNEARAGETPEWTEFLRLLKKARPHCPINGLFLVLSIDSLIKDSAEEIARKAGRLAQQLDLIQRTLDVRFPVYLLVTKCDLLTGFREFFDNIDDPLLQHQIFGWSNPDPLDAHFRPDLVEQHLMSITDRLRRRRLALLRETSAGSRFGDTTQFSGASHQLSRGPSAARRLDEVDALFALPESVMRLAPRLRRYLEAIFVGSEWSAKPVFLRGIYFTSSMREGKALDEAIAFATGLTLDQLPEERSWERNKAFFLRDLFHEKVFRESGLVTRATNTLKLLRKRKLLIFGTTAAAMLIFVIFIFLGFGNLKLSVGLDAAYWKVAADNLKQGEWSPTIVSPVAGESRFVYDGNKSIEGTGEKLMLVQYHGSLKQASDKRLATGLFTPLAWLGLGQVGNRPQAQRLVFEASVVQPLVRYTRNTMERVSPPPQSSAAVQYHRDALLSLMQIEADIKVNGEKGGPLAKTNSTQKSDRYLRSFLSYLTGTTNAPDTNLVAVFAATYSREGWPPASLNIPGGGDYLSNNVPIQTGLENYRVATRVVEASISNEVQRVNDLVDSLGVFADAEAKWLTNASCPLPPSLEDAKRRVDKARAAVSDAPNLVIVAARYAKLKKEATDASVNAFTNLFSELSGADQTRGIFAEISKRIGEFKREAGAIVSADYEARASGIDTNFVAPPTNSLDSISSFEKRWSLYTGACLLASARTHPDDSMIGDGWKRYVSLEQTINQYRDGMRNYQGPYARLAFSACERIAGRAESEVKQRYVDNYIVHVTNKLEELVKVSSINEVTNARSWFDRVESDLNLSNKVGEQANKLEAVKVALAKAENRVVANYAGEVIRRLKPKLRFPVVLSADPSTSLTPQELLDLRKLLDQLQADFQNPVWQSFPSSGKILGSLRTNAYTRVVNSLVKPDGTRAEMEILFIRPEPGRQDWDVFSDTVRYAKVFVGGAERSNFDLSALDKPTPLARAPVDAEVTIRFYRDVNRTRETAVWQQANWMLPRLLREGRAERNNDGTQWKLQLEVKEVQRTLTAFAMRLLDGPLPKREEWPQP